MPILAKEGALTGSSLGGGDHAVQGRPVLFAEGLCIPVVGSHQFLMGANNGNAPFLENNDLIGTDHAGKPVGDENDGGGGLFPDAKQGLLENLLHIQLRRAELDQQETFEALTAFRYFIEDHPGSPLVADARQRIIDCRSRLAKKQYLSGRLYHKQGYLDAAKITYAEVLRDYPDTGWYYTTLFRMGEIAQTQGDIDLAVRYWKEVLQDSGDEVLMEDVLQHLSGLSKSTG